jgi:ring-1,2-phenylacetyl-CoA epoxidase subunit PaaE
MSTKALPARALPDPGEPVPGLAVPTVFVFFGALGVFAVSTVAAINHSVPRAVTIAVNTAVCFLMFTIVHDASRYSISGWCPGRSRWITSSR